MKERSFDEMITYFNRRVADMDISQDCKMELLGMVTALGYKHEKTAQQWIPCSDMEPKESGYYLCTHGGSGFVGLDYYTTQEQAEELFADPEDEYLDLEEYIGWTSKNVIAWMHRPEPWEGEEDGNQRRN